MACFASGAEHLSPFGMPFLTNPFNSLVLASFRFSVRSAGRPASMKRAKFNSFRHTHCTDGQNKTLRKPDRSRQIHD